MEKTKQNGRDIIVDEERSPEDIYDLFLQSKDLLDGLDYFYQLCESLDVNPQNYKTVYTLIKTKLNSWKCRSLWNKLDKKAKHADYKNRPCSKLKVMVIGAGPCGLRAAVELALLGAHVVVIEKRDAFSRNNVLHLWPFLIVDLKALGAKSFFGKFCSGSLDHISIRKLQLILLKVALLLGVQICPQTAFVDLVEPTADHGWRANFLPKTSPLNTFDFDAIIGADGKRNTLKGFKRREFRGKLAIAVTCNFVNRNSQEECRVEEISGVAFIFNQQFFQTLKDKTGIDLENIVYYKDETHYFVMTAKKASLLAKGVLKKDYNEIDKLLSSDNINHSNLLVYSREAADFSTNYQLPHHEFAKNHYGKEDVALFDFTSIFAAENSSRILERKGKRLLMGIVGDTLLEPFWPTGSGCARGFLGCLDVAWMIRGMGMNRNPVELIQERESIYKRLAQTKPDNLMKDQTLYSTDPRTRYPNLSYQIVKKEAAQLHYDCSSNPVNLERDQPAVRPALRDIVTTPGDEDSIDPNILLKWCKEQTKPYQMVSIKDFGHSWKNGLGFCAILHRFRPDLIDINALTPNDHVKNCQLAFDVAEQELGLSPKVSARDFVACNPPDRLAVISYVSLYYDSFKNEIPAILKSPQLPRQQRLSSKEPTPLAKKSPASKMSILSRLSRRSRVKSDKKKTAALLAKYNEELKSDELIIKNDSNANQPIVQPAQSDVPESDVPRKNIVEDMKDVPVKKIVEDVKDVVKPKKKFKLKKKSTAVKQADTSDTPQRERKQSKISQLAQDVFGVPMINAAMKRDKKRLSESETCYFCKKHVYVMERMSAEGHFFHRKCFSCSRCGCTLLLGNYAYMAEQDDAMGLFYCNIHYNQIIYGDVKDGPDDDDASTATAENLSPRGKKARPVTQLINPRSLEEAFPELSPTSSPRNTADEIDGQQTPTNDGPPCDPDSPASPYRHLEARPLIRHHSLTRKKPSPQKVTIKEAIIMRPSLKHAVSSPALQLLFAEDKKLAEDLCDGRQRNSSLNDQTTNGPRNPPKKRLTPSKDLKDAVKSLMEKDNDWDETRPPTPGRTRLRLQSDLVESFMRDDRALSNRRMQYPESVSMPDTFMLPGLKPVAIDINYEDAFSDDGNDGNWGKKKKKKYILKKKKLKTSKSECAAVLPKDLEEKKEISKPSEEKKLLRKSPIWKSRKMKRESSLVENDEWVIVDKEKLPPGHRADRDDEGEASQSSTDESDVEDGSQGGLFKRAFATRPKMTYGKKTSSADEEKRQKKKERKQISMQLRQRHLKRLWQAQSIQRKLYEVEVRQNELDENATRVEKKMRDADISQADEGKLMMDWLRLVNDKNILLRFESELVIQSKSIQLEDQQARLEQRVRDLLTADVVKLSHQSQIDSLTKELVDTVEQRNNLVEMLEDDRLRELEEDKTLSKVLAKKAQELGMDRLI